MDISCAIKNGVLGLSVLYNLEILFELVANLVWQFEESGIPLSEQKDRVLPHTERSAEAWIGPTPNTVLGEEDVIFGVTMSGRNISIQGMEEAVDLCVNTVPIRAIALSENGILWLRATYKKYGKKDLFDTAIVYQNYTKFLPDMGLLFRFRLSEASEKADIPLNFMASSTAVNCIHVAAMVHKYFIRRFFLVELFQGFDEAL
ncbi:hypothetical protein F4678DRAFT_467245 [Xylaria arbuscula]|nr:hypothetical protein F4678DRAFT_467245 [Xylaria arbuscula]